MRYGSIRKALAPLAAAAIAATIAAYVVLDDQPDEPPTIMIVGDSISHGLEGDYTWRYRLHEHLKTWRVDVDFVGPYRGTNVIPGSPPAASAIAAPAFHGAYRNGIAFDNDHLAVTGMQVSQFKNDVKAQVDRYHPDYLLVALGFNDLSWSGREPTAVVDDIAELVRNARAGRPDIRILVANVVHRTPLPHQPELAAIINGYNGKLKTLLAALSTTESPTRLVDVSPSYDPRRDSYDGLHPNLRGEFKIAHAFAEVLAGEFDLGGSFAAAPSSESDWIPQAPGWIRAQPTADGMRLEWEHSVGAAGYSLYVRDVTVGQPFQRAPLSVGADSWVHTQVVARHEYEFYVVPIRGIYEGPASSRTRATAVTASGQDGRGSRPSA